MPLTVRAQKLFQVSIVIVFVFICCWLGMSLAQIKFLDRILFLRKKSRNGLLKNFWVLPKPHPNDVIEVGI